MDARDLESLFRVKFTIGALSRQPLLRDDTDAAPGTIGDFKDFGEHFLCRGIAVIGHDARVGVLHLGARPDSSCTTARRMPSSRSSGSKPVTTIGM